MEGNEQACKSETSKGTSRHCEKTDIDDGEKKFFGSKRANIKGWSNEENQVR